MSQLSIGEDSSDSLVCRALRAPSRTSSSAPTPVYLELAQVFRCQIMSGSLRAGDRLLPAQQLAEVAGVNSNTLLRALRILRDEGLISFGRGTGMVITDLAGNLASDGGLCDMLAVRSAVKQALASGASRAAILDIVSGCFNDAGLSGPEPEVGAGAAI